MTYDVSNNEGNTNKKLQIMWISSPKHDFDVNWFALGFGEEVASKNLYKKLALNKKLEGFNRKPSFRDGEPSSFAVHDFELRVKVIVKMTSHSRASLKLKIKELKKKDYDVVQVKWD
jgi:hypothetical protein